MKAKVFNGKEFEERDIPDIFDEYPRPDLIRRAVLAEESREYQPKGVYPLAGMQTSADYIGRKEVWRSLKNRGQAKLPREKLADGRMGRVRVIPSAVGGRRAHPPKVEKILEERINKKEWLRALRSAIAMTAMSEAVKARGHRFDAELPLVLDVPGVLKTKEALAIVKAIGVAADIERAKRGRRPRPNSRYGGTITPKSILIVCEDVSQYRGFDNLPGVDVVSYEALKVKDLAPGAHPARLTVYTLKALEGLSQRVKG